MYRISVTSLEAFRRFRDKHSIWDTEERLLNVLAGIKEPNAYTAIGSCFHKIVETGKATYVGRGIFEQVKKGLLSGLTVKPLKMPFFTGINFLMPNMRYTAVKTTILHILIYMYMVMRI